MYLPDPADTAASRRLDGGSFARPVVDVARDLLGCLLVTRRGDLTTSVRIVETEAYARDDPASHSFRGPTARNASMFAGPGTLYVYLIYGVHHCANVVTGSAGEGSAVLLRAGEPLAGQPAMQRRRERSGARDLCRGPGRLTQAMGIRREDDGIDLVTSPEIWLEYGEPEENIVTSTRIGVRKGSDTPWRFFLADDPWVSEQRHISTSER